MRIKQNKKGVVAELYVDLFAFLSLIFLLVIFTLIIHLGGCGKSSMLTTSENLTEGIVATDDLLTYLKMPVGNLEMIDEIRYAYVQKDKNTQNLVVQKTRTFLNKMKPCSEVRIVEHMNDPQSLVKNKELATITSNHCDFLNYNYFFECSNMNIPSFDTSKTLKVYMCLSMLHNYASGAVASQQPIGTDMNIPNVP